MAPIEPITGQHPRCARDLGHLRESQASLLAKTENCPHDGNFREFRRQTARLLLTLLSEHRTSLLVARRLAAAQLGEAHPRVGEYQAQLREADEAVRELEDLCEVAA